MAEVEMEAQVESVGLNRGYEQTLISTARVRKFELLLHLLENGGQALVVCGPNGIGKSAFFELLRQHQDESATILTLQISPELTFDNFVAWLLSQLEVKKPTRLTREERESTLAERLRIVEQNGRRIVLLLDDAGQLAPGLVTQIYRYAALFAALNLVMAMTPDELQIKSFSDPEIDGCNVIEIPPLSKEECGEYLKNLSGKSDGLIQFKAVTAELVDRVYCKAHGIPGKINSVLPEVNAGKIGEALPKSIPLESLLLAVIIIIGALYVVTSVKDEEKKSEGEIYQGLVFDQPSAAEVESEAVSESPAETATELAAEKPDETVATALVAQKTAASLESADEDPQPDSTQGENSDALPAEQQQEESSDALMVDAEKSEGLEEEVANEDEEESGDEEEPSLLSVKGKKWLLEQDPAHYTLQLFAVRDLNALKQYLIVHSQLSDVAYFESKRDGKRWYSLVSGIYPSLNAAKQAAKELPSSIRTPWLRRLKPSQKIINENQ